MILLRRYKTKIVKKQPTLEASEIFPTEKSTSNKLCTVLPTVVFFNISISFCHYSCLFKINQSILYSAIFKFRPSDKFRPSIFGTQFFYFFQIRKQAKKSAIIFSYQSQISIRFMLDLTYLKIHISVPKSIPSE
jgi:hypothetical protein